MKQPEYIEGPEALENFKGLASAILDLLSCGAKSYYSIPNSFVNAFHFPSTNAFVFASITISSGHGRLKPSVDHFRVASIPIFEP
jgi:hypothetical protein